MKPHKHAELIKAWADGAEIEAKLVEKRKETAWELCLDPWWNDPAFEYRIKPEPKPDVVELVCVERAYDTVIWGDGVNNLKLIWEGSELKSAEVLK